MTNSRAKGCREDWVPVFGYEGMYEVSSLGRIKGLDRVTIRKNGVPISVKERFLKPGLCDKGYPQVCLGDGRKGTTMKVHRIVMISFVGPRKKGMTVNHMNGIKSDNRLENLEYCTRRENSLHAIAMGLYDPATLAAFNRGKGKKLNKEKVRDIRARVGAGERRAVLAEEYGVHVMTVGEIVRGEIWQSV